MDSVHEGQKNITHLIKGFTDINNMTISVDAEKNLKQTSKKKKNRVLIFALKLKDRKTYSKEVGLGAKQVSLYKCLIK